MKKFYLIGFILLLFFDTFGQTNFKLTSLAAFPFEPNLDWLNRVFSHCSVYLVILGYTGAFITWMVLLKKVPVGPAFAVSHLQIVTVMIVSVVIFNEQITWNRVLGGVAIIIGIVLLAIAEHKIHRRKSGNKKREL